MLEIRLKFQGNLFLRIQLTIFLQLFRSWLGADQATNHYLNQWWLDYQRIYASLGLNELTHCGLMAPYSNRPESTLSQVVACCLTAWCPEPVNVDFPLVKFCGIHLTSHFTASAQVTILNDELENKIFKIYCKVQEINSLVPVKCGHHFRKKSAKTTSTSRLYQCKSRP